MQVLYCEKCNDRVFESDDDVDVFYDESNSHGCVVGGGMHEIDPHIERCTSCNEYDTVLFMLNADNNKRCLDCHNEARGYDLGSYDDEDY